MPRPQLTNEKILRRLRSNEEHEHRRFRKYFFGLGLLTLPLSLPISEVILQQIQDSCNKSTAIYSITPHLKGHTEAYCRDGRNRDDIIYSIYEQWFRNHQINIDFGNFIAKLIRVKIPSVEQRPTIKDIATIHKAWCGHVEFNPPLCSGTTDSAGREMDDPSFEFQCCFGMNRKQNMHYKLKPLFRALFMIVDHHT